jgi:MFS family permease
MDRDMSNAFLIACDAAVARTDAKSYWGGGCFAILLASCVGCSLVFVSSAIINVALAAIANDLQLSPQQLQWIINAELLPLAALTLVGGALGDQIGQKRAFLSGIAIFGLASLFGTLASNPDQLIGARFLQGVGEALILPNGLTILNQTFSGVAKSRAIGVWSASAAIASAAAPALAGFMLDQGSWRATFFTNAPLALVAFVLVAVGIPKALRNPPASIDLFGAALSVLGLGAFGWWLTSLTTGMRSLPLVAAGVTATVMAFAALAVTERYRGSRAMLPPALFASRTVVGLNAFTILLYGAFATSLTLFPFVIIRGIHMAAIVAGLVFLPLQILVTVISPLAASLSERLGQRFLLVAGAAIAGIGCVLTLRINVDAHYWTDIFPAVLLIAFGMSLVLAPLTTLVLTSVDRGHAATASGFNSAISRAGSLAAIALLGGVLQQAGGDLIHSFHAAMLISTGACFLAALTALGIASEKRNLTLAE